ncbi:hypothetical protein KSC_111190 [Ktedonobacter sp. SOSP1-52]|nr:hypothetical protein KSC_111190 [Ktedonobacter sp. SOSP1-52]
MRDAYRGTIALVHKSLALEYVNSAARSWARKASRRIAQRHYQPVQDIRWCGEHLQGYALSWRIEVDDRDL